MISIKGQNIRRNLFGFILVLAVVVLSPRIASRAQEASQEAVLIVAADKSVMDPNEFFDVRVILNAYQPTLAAQCRLNFDPDLVELIAVEEGDFFKSWAEASGKSTIMLPDKPTVDKETGLIPTIGVAVLGSNFGEGASGSGTLLIYHLRARSEAKGTLGLNLDQILVSDAGQKGEIAALQQVFKQDSIVLIGEGPAPAQPAIEKAIYQPFAETQGPEISPPALKSIEPHSQQADQAVAYLSIQKNIPQDKLIIVAEESRKFPLTGRNIQAIKILDVRPLDPTNPHPSYGAYVDVETGEIMEDLANVEQAEAEARLLVYGRLDPGLHAKIQTLKDDEEVTVMVWSLPGPGQSLEELEAQAREQIVEKYPEANEAVSNGQSKLGISDDALKQSVEKEYYDWIGAGMAERVNGLLAYLRVQGLEPHAFEGAPFVSVRLSKMQLLDLEKHADVGTCCPKEVSMIKIIPGGSAIKFGTRDSMILAG